MKFMQIDDQGTPIAFYSEDIHGSRTRPLFGNSVMRPAYGPAPEPTEADPNPERPVIGEELDPTVEPNPPIVGEEPNPNTLIPPDAIEITDEQWQELLTYQGRRRWIDGQIVEHAPPPPPPPPVIVSDMFNRMTDNEAEALDTAMMGEALRIRRNWTTAQVIQPSDDIWSILLGHAITLFGGDRAHEILGLPTTDSPVATA